MKTLLQKITSVFSNVVFYFSIFIFIIAFNFAHNPPGGWYQQFLPDLNSSPISDICFVDSLIGYAVTNYEAIGETDYVLKTTNGGDNWIIIRKDSSEFAGFNRIVFLNRDTGFISGVNGPEKTTNAGINWFTLNNPVPALTYDDMNVFDNDTMWLAASSGFDGGVFRTTNGGVNWIQQLNLGSNNPDKIYMFNSRIGFISSNGGTRYVRKTTDSGNNWFLVISNDYFNDIYFADSLTGWKCSVFGMKKTIDGGLNWVTQQIPSGGMVINSAILTFSNVSRDTLWGAGGALRFPNNQIRSILYRTVDGGDNWTYQIPDTSINIGQYYYVNFVNNFYGWANPQNNNKLIHTTIGGDTSFTGINSNNIVLSYAFELHQNYPNPFNPKTKIKYELLKGGYVKLKVFDISGKQVVTLVSKKQNAGSYEVEFNGDVLPSGIYFYEIEVTANNDFFTDTKKMILIH